MILINILHFFLQTIIGRLWRSTDSQERVPACSNWCHKLGYGMRGWRRIWSLRQDFIPQGVDWRKDELAYILWVWTWCWRIMESFVSCWSIFIPFIRLIKILLIKKCIEIQIQLYWSKTWTGSFSFPTSISLTEVSVEEKEIL